MKNQKTVSLQKVKYFFVNNFNMWQQNAVSTTSIKAELSNLTQSLNVRLISCTDSLHICTQSNGLPGHLSALLLNGIVLIFGFLEFERFLILELIVAIVVVELFNRIGSALFVFVIRLGHLIDGVPFAIIFVSNQNISKFIKVDTAVIR